MNKYIYTYIYIHMCVCVCVSEWIFPALIDKSCKLHSTI